MPSVYDPLSVADILRQFLISQLQNPLPGPTGNAFITNDNANPVPVHSVDAFAGLTDTQLRAAALNVLGPLTNAELRAAAVGVNDYFNASEYLNDFTGTGAVQDFTFTSPVQLAFIRARGSDVRFSAAGTPTASFGAIAGDGESTPVPRAFTTVKIYVPTGTVVTVWGYRYA